ncbi:MAG: hypothetical protein HRU78_02415 [Gammaproteobacteria bacterium]|nr:MAG: hypothetical protein HRU78_02415 [Gammaproteobacteria bacterium]
MTTDKNSLEHWANVFAQSSIEELIVYCVELGIPAPLEKLGALQKRFIDIAFHEKETPHNVRSVAASWIRALESVAIVSFHEQPEFLNIFMNARDQLMEHAIEYGYGTAIYQLSINGNEIWNIFADNETPETQQVKERRTYLIHTAFGRAEDVPEE